VPNDLLIGFIAGAICGYSGYSLAIGAYFMFVEQVRPRFKAWRVRRAQRLYPIGWRNR